MSVFHSDDLDSDIVLELIEDISDHYAISERALLLLDSHPEDAELIDSLFRSVHTIKGDLGIVGFSPAMPLMTAVEDLLGIIRQGTIAYMPMMSDLVLLILDQVRTYVDSFRAQGYVEYEAGYIAELSERIEQVIAADANRPELIAAAIRLLDPGVVIESQATGEDGVLFTDGFLEQMGLSQDRDLEFFREMIAPVERRSFYWEGRGDRILKMALILNELGGRPVDEKQMAVAVYVHDFGMAFMPLELLHKESTLTNSEILLLRSHVQSSAHLLQNMDAWQPAREIVLQHHEAVNGSGYPYGLREKEICDGAKILAIADTFDALTHQRAYSTHQKRPIIRAVKELNECAGYQLSSHWVDIFNQAVQPVLLKHRARQL